MLGVTDPNERKTLFKLVSVVRSEMTKAEQNKSSAAGQAPTAPPSNPAPTPQPSSHHPASYQSPAANVPSAPAQAQPSQQFAAYNPAPPQQQYQPQPQQNYSAYSNQPSAPAPAPQAPINRRVSVGPGAGSAGANSGSNNNAGNGGAVLSNDADWSPVNLPSGMSGMGLQMFRPLISSHMTPFLSHHHITWPHLSILDT